MSIRSRGVNIDSRSQAELPARTEVSGSEREASVEQAEGL